MTNRYLVKSGKYGSYFYDDKVEKSLTLQDTLNLLNDFERLKKDYSSYLGLTID